MNLLRFLVATVAVAMMICSAADAAPPSARSDERGRTRHKNRKHHGKKRTKNMKPKQMRLLKKLLSKLGDRDMPEVIPVDPNPNPQTYGQVDTDGTLYAQVNKPTDSRQQSEIKCGLAPDKLQLLACPTADKMNRYKCIDDHKLCDRIPHCPNGEDEDPLLCMFHKNTMMYIERIMDAIVQKLKTPGLNKGLRLPLKDMSSRSSFLA